MNQYATTMLYLDFWRPSWKTACSPIYTQLHACQHGFSKSRDPGEHFELCWQLLLFMAYQLKK